MSYCLEYNPELRNQYPPVRKKQHAIPMPHLLYGLGAVILCYVLIGLGWMHYLIPGNLEITVMAWKEMLQQVGAGESVGESIHTFFSYVIINGA